MMKQTVEHGGLNSLMDAITKKLCDEASNAFNEMVTIGAERKAVFNELQSIERDNEAYEKLRWTYYELQAKWDAALTKFLAADLRRTEAFKREKIF